MGILKILMEIGALWCNLGLCYTKLNTIIKTTHSFENCYIFGIL